MSDDTRIQMGSFVELDAMADPHQRRRAALMRLDRISRIALGLTRANKDGTFTPTPDCHSAIKVELAAHELLRIEKTPYRPAAPNLQAFDRPRLVPEKKW